MENLSKVDTLKNVKLNDFLTTNGIDFGNKTKSPKKTDKQKLIDSIVKEVGVISERSDLELLTVGDENNSRKELRFHNKPKDNGTIEFNLKYKSKIVKLGEYEVLRCDNDVEVYTETLNKLKDYVETLDSSDEVFKQLS